MSVYNQESTDFTELSTLNIELLDSSNQIAFGDYQITVLSVDTTHNRTITLADSTGDEILAFKSDLNNVSLQNCYDNSSIPKTIDVTAGYLNIISSAEDTLLAVGDNFQVTWTGLYTVNSFSQRSTVTSFHLLNANNYNLTLGVDTSGASAGYSTILLPKNTYSAANNSVLRLLDNTTGLTSWTADGLTNYLPLARGSMTGQINFYSGQTWPTFNQNTSGTAATVTTNANLTGVITSSGNATSFGSFTSSEILNGCSDETGSGSLVFSNSPNLTGNPTCTTQLSSDNSARIASTYYVTSACSGKANLSGATMTGQLNFYSGQTWPTFNQDTTGTSSHVITNANLSGVITSSGNATSFGSFTSAQILSGCSDETGSGSMVFNYSPNLIGDPTCTTQLSSDNSARIASTYYVTTACSTKANIASPSFTGVPLSTTPSTGDNSTKIATTAFVTSSITASTPSLQNLYQVSSPQIISSSSYPKLTLRSASTSYDDTIFSIDDAVSNVSTSISGNGSLVLGSYSPTTSFSWSYGGSYAYLMTVGGSTYLGPTLGSGPYTPAVLCSLLTMSFLSYTITWSYNNRFYKFVCTGGISVSNMYIPLALIGFTGWTAGLTTYSGSFIGTYNTCTIAPIGTTIDSPSFTGIPLTTTPFTADNSTKIANTAYVKNNLSNYAMLFSPTFTGVPLTTTATTSDNSTQIASTAYVKNNLASITTSNITNLTTTNFTIGSTSLSATATQLNYLANVPTSWSPVMSSDTGSTFTQTSSGTYLLVSPHLIKFSGTINWTAKSGTTGNIKISSPLGLTPYSSDIYIPVTFDYTGWGTIKPVYISAFYGNLYVITGPPLSTIHIGSLSTSGLIRFDGEMLI